MSRKDLMMLVLLLSLVTGAVLASGCVGQETPPQIIEDITPQEAFALIQDNRDNPDFVIIDVRTPEEFAEEHIEDAINLDYYSETFQDELDTLDRDKTYLIYCRSGGRSGNALDIMAELDFREAYNMLGGINGWLAEGLPTTKESPTQENYVCMVYFTGIGCPHCARADPVVLEQLPGEYPNLVIVEYEIYEQEQNAPVLDAYNDEYYSGYVIPLTIFNPDQYLGDDSSILRNVRRIINELDSNKFPLMDGSSQDFNDLDLTSLPSYPKIWHQQKILIKMGPKGNGELLRRLLIDDNLPDVLQDTEFKIVEPIEVVLSGKTVEFDNGISIDDWIFQWNGEAIAIPPPAVEPTPPEVQPPPVAPKPSLTLPKVLTLAAVDAVNPCALAVLLLMLVSILAYNPRNRRGILLAGLAFISSVFVMYFLYGLVIIKFFQVIQALALVRFWLFKALAVAAIVFGVLNIRDFIRYKPGGLGTEMPLLLRPRVKKMLSRITSTRGALLAGVFVTVFLLPCTIGPYIIAAGILSVFDMLANVPILLLYNLIFILPMLAIVGGVYLGLGRVHDVYLWKERNISKLHLIAGITILGLGIAMLSGLV